MVIEIYTRVLAKTSSTLTTLLAKLGQPTGNSLGPVDSYVEHEYDRKDREDILALYFLIANMIYLGQLGMTKIS